MATLRTPETEQKYKEWRAENADYGACIFCEREPLKSFTYWKIVPNLFPYDRIAERHEVITPLRHVTSSQLNEEEKKELQTIKDEHLLAEYDFLLEGTHKTMSVPAHFHLHLVDLKKIL